MSAQHDAGHVSPRARVADTDTVTVSGTDAGTGTHLSDERQPRAKRGRMHTHCQPSDEADVDRESAGVKLVGVPARTSKSRRTEAQAHAAVTPLAEPAPAGGDGAMAWRASGFTLWLETDTDSIEGSISGLQKFGAGRIVFRPRSEKNELVFCVAPRNGVYRYRAFSTRTKHPALTRPISYLTWPIS